VCESVDVGVLEILGSICIKLNLPVAASTLCKPLGTGNVSAWLRMYSVYMQCLNMEVLHALLHSSRGRGRHISV